MPHCWEWECHVQPVASHHYLRIHYMLPNRPNYESFQAEPSVAGQTCSAWRNREIPSGDLGRD